ncbi:MAG: hypothetical protein ACK5SP_01790 [bacterium]|jgi:hypothetical protein
MPTEIYKSAVVELIDGTELYITPLKIKFLKLFLDEFENVKLATNDDEAIDALAKCTVIAMRQYYPLIRTQEELEDNIDMPSIYRILDFAAGIKINEKAEETVKKQATESGSTWDDLDLAELESEVFLLGIWKDYEELESSMSMPEIIATLKIKRDLDYSQKKFLAAMQGVDLDKANNNNSNAWEEMKARVFSKGKANDPNDITALQGYNAQKAGFGIGMGLDYEDLTQK